MANPPRKWLLTQNSELKEIGAFNWTLPAFITTLNDGSKFNTCQSAGVCASVCYARQGAYTFPSVKSAHVKKLEMVLYDLPGWVEEMKLELTHKRYLGKHIRIHDAGDFFSDDYTKAWLDIAESTPTSIFYAYTREVSRFKRVVTDETQPVNFFYLFSYGGKEDHLIDDDEDRHCDVFPSLKAMREAGYDSQHVSDLQAIYNENHRVGVPYNNIPKFKKKLDGRTFREWQQEQNDKRAMKGYE
jgi:hypothetical protein